MVQKDNTSAASATEGLTPSRLTSTGMDMIFSGIKKKELGICYLHDACYRLVSC